VNAPWPLLLLIIAGLLFAVVLTLLPPAPRSRTRANTPAVFRDDDRYWYGRDLFYNNPDDPAVFVPKRYTRGYTVNVGRPAGKLIMLASLVLLLALGILKALPPH